MTDPFEAAERAGGKRSATDHEGGTGAIRNTTASHLLSELGKNRKVQTITASQMKMMIIELVRRELKKEEHGLDGAVRANILLNLGQDLAHLFPAPPQGGAT